MTDLTHIEAFILALGALGFGTIMLVKGGNWTIDAAVFIARRFGVSPLVIGFTVVAFGTSLPELIVSVNASLHGSPEIAVGNVLGSNIANILLVAGAAGLFATLTVPRGTLTRDLAAMIVATAGLTALMLTGGIGRLAGGIMIGLLLLYVFWQYRMALREKTRAEDIENPVFISFPAAIVSLIGGLALIALGAEFMVRGATVSAEIIGVPEAVIGLSVIALGTSLPELSTCVIAARRGQSDLILGNVIGSNVFNIMMILGATALVRPVVTADIAPQLVDLDIWVTLGVSILFTIWLLIRHAIGRMTAFVFVGAYIAYVVGIYALYIG
ncbi:MAG: calcium/sodium antiporter [Alphaproteobacteria bacterium]|nr:calcium/sodium antiporter [Alphaproteobacteria bacterium]